MKRDGITPELAEQILAAQAGRDERMKIADDVLDNNGSVTELPEKIALLHRHYLQLANATGQA